MQSKLFVFVGLIDEPSEDRLNLLLKELAENLSTNHSELEINLQELLLSTSRDNVRFYITLVNSKNDLSYYIELANNFELSIDLNPTSIEELNERYTQIKRTFPSLYTDIHYATATSIFREMEKYPGIKIYSFQ